MVPDKIKKLLKKKRLSGEELGLLLVYSAINDQLNSKGGKPRGALFPQSVFNSMTDETLTNEKDVAEFTLFNNMLTSITDGYNSSIADKQRFYHGFYRVLMELQELERTNNAVLALQLQPLVITQKELDEGRAQALERYRNREQSFCQTFFHILAHCLKEGADTGELNVAEILADYAKRPATHGEPENYGALYNLGRIELPNGVTSNDFDTREEWHKACRPFLLERLTPSQLDEVEKKRAQLFFMGADYARAYFERVTGHKPQLADKELLEDIDAEPERKGDLYEALLACYGITYKDTNPPLDTLTLLDQAKLYVKLYDFAQNDTERKAILHTVEKYLPELYGTIVGYMGKLLPEVKTLKRRDVSKPIATQGKLLEAGVCSYKEEVKGYAEDLRNLYPEDTTAHLLKRQQLVNAGVAIHKPSPLFEALNESKLTATSFLEHFPSLDKLARNKEEIAGLQTLRRTHILESYRALLASNAMFSLLEKVFAVPNLCDAFSCDIAKLERQMYAFNEILYKFNAMIFGTEAHKAQQRATLKKAFEPLDFWNYSLERQNIDAVEEEMRRDSYSPTSCANMLYFRRYYFPMLLGASK